MLSNSFRILCVAAALGTTLRADWKITTVVRSGLGQSVETEYFKAGLRRTDRFDDIKRRSDLIIVLDFDRLRQTVWNTGLREYAVRRIRRGNTPQATGLELVIERATVDTGERRDFFGRVARHLITHETLSNAGWSGSGEIDGWYVDSEFLPREKRGTVVHLLTAGDARPRVRVNQTGPAPAGLAVKESQISHYTLPNGSRGVNERTIEVTELSEAPLPNDLFRPPPGFNRVISFPGDVPLAWTDRLGLEWERFEDYISSIFG